VRLAICHEVLCITVIHERDKARVAVRQKVNVHEQTTADRINDIDMRGTVRDAEHDRAWLTIVIVSGVTYKFMASMFSAGVSANSRILGARLVVAVILRAMFLVLGGVVLLAAGNRNRQGVATVTVLVVLGRARVISSGLDHALQFVGLVCGISLKKDDAHFDPLLSKEDFQVV
jgi:hypothetical protein